MSGYKLRLILYTQTETWREVEIPDNITFERLHYIIQKLFGFENYHMWDFKIPNIDPDSDEINLEDIKMIVDSDNAFDIMLNEVFDESIVALYEYDFGDSWMILVHKVEDTEYKNKTALVTDYKGKYNPREDLGGVFVFEEIMENIDGGNLDYVLDEYGLNRRHLSSMDFEKKFKKGSRIRLNDAIGVWSLR